jgi:hypothetical protein
MGQRLIQHLACEGVEVHELTHAGIQEKKYQQGRDTLNEDLSFKHVYTI